MKGSSLGFGGKETKLKDASQVWVERSLETAPDSGKPPCMHKHTVTTEVRML